MRYAGVLALLAIGCNDSATKSTNPYCGNGVTDPGEECDAPGIGNCDDNCDLLRVEVVAHWSFVTLAGDASPCLDGNPPVDVRISGGVLEDSVFTLPCEPGQGQGSSDPEFSSVRVASTTDHEYAGELDDVARGVDLPLVSIYTDAGSMRVFWSLDSMGTPATCNYDPLAKVRLFANEVMIDERACSDAYGKKIDLVPAGLQSLRGEELDAGGNVVASSSPVDMDVLAGTENSFSPILIRTP